MNTNIRSKVYSHGQPFRRTFFMEDNNRCICNRDGTKEYHIVDVKDKHKVTHEILEQDCTPEIQQFLKSIQYLPENNK